MRGIVLRYTVFFILAMIGFYLAVKFFMGIPGKAERAGCMVVGCDEYPNFESIQLRSSSIYDFLFKVMPYVGACWEESGKGRAKSNIACYEIYMPYTGGPYSKEEITKAIRDGGYPEGFYEFRVKEIPKKYAVFLILYNSTIRKVVVI